MERWLARVMPATPQERAAYLDAGAVIFQSRMDRAGLLAETPVKKGGGDMSTKTIRGPRVYRFDDFELDVRAGLADHLALRQRVCEWNPGRTAARADVHDRALEAPDHIDDAQAVLEQNPPRLLAGERG